MPPARSPRFEPAIEDRFLGGLLHDGFDLGTRQPGRSVVFRATSGTLVGVISLLPAERLRYLVANECQLICRLLSASEFVTYCRDRGLDTDAARLERFDKLGVFRPLARLRRPRIREKVLTESDGRVRSLGLVGEGDAWAGDIREGYADFSWDREDAMWFLENGHLWHPTSRQFAAWDSTTRDKNHWTIEEAYYSRFQISDLRWVQPGFTMQVVLDAFADSDAAGFGGMAEDLAAYTRAKVEHYQKEPYDDASAFLLQVLSNRYYPLTQTDRRTFTLSPPMRFPKWDWYEFVRAWDAKRVANDVGASAAEVRRLHGGISIRARSVDPVGAWYDLVCFVSVDKRTRLTGDAQYAQSQYVAEHMLRLYHEDLTGEKLYPPDESPTWTRDAFLGAGVTGNLLRHLEFVTNSYHLNPRPCVILLVEGQGEADQFPRIIEKLLNVPLGPLGIEVRNLQGVGEFTGKSGKDRYGALEKFIDDYHYRQTIVFVILDNEGRVPLIRQRLIEAPSKLFPARRLTRPEYIHLWDRCVEFDNFTPAEIGTALTATAELRHTFTEADVLRCMEEYDARKTNPLGALYRGVLDYALPKPALLGHLVSGMIAKGAAEFDAEGKGNRPLVRVLQRVVRAAVGNPQPVRQESWVANQESGFLGEKLERPPGSFSEKGREPEGDR
jgi:hypothetical protein